MKDVSTGYLTFFLLSTFISIISVPLFKFLHKKNMINAKNGIGMIYSIIFSALFISIASPQFGFLDSIKAHFSFIDPLQNILLDVRGSGWTFLVSMFSSEQQVYVGFLYTLVFICFTGFLFYFVSLGIMFLKIHSLKKMRKIGGLNILIDRDNITPHVFSFWNKSYVVVPEHVLEEKNYLRTAIRHELQHIRNGDTHSIYFWQMFKCLMWVNPFVHIILAYIKSLQELRVDENLIYDKKINYKMYLKTLGWFIDEGRPLPHYSLSHSMFGWSSFKELKMRVSNIHRVRPIRSQPLVCLLFLAGNIFALIIIGNSSPKFEYSLLEVEKMYMPDYMKTEFEVRSDEFDDAFNPILRTIEFGKERDVTINRTYRILGDIRNKTILNESFMNEIKDGVLLRKILDINYQVKVVEYSDNYCVVRIKSSYIPLEKIEYQLNDKNLNQEILDKFFRNYAKLVVNFDREFKFKFGEYFMIDELGLKMMISRKRIPQRTNFFSQLKDI